MKELLKKIPNVKKLMEELNLTYQLSNEVILKECINNNLDKLRKDILENKIDTFDKENLVENIINDYEKQENYHHQSIINATGVILHTNLGRAVLSDKQLENIDILKGYNNLEFDIDTQKRGSRYKLVEEAITKVCGCEAALVVNNNASAVMLILNEFAADKEVIVSNSELVEIGGSFRIPEIIKLSGAIMKNVGTTNKTNINDYIEAINEQTGLIAKIHQSNFYIQGFTASVDAKDLVDYRDDNNIGVVIYEDLASGAIFDLSKYGLDKEPTVIDSVKAGIDIISFSGDKLLGGVQAGIIVGKKQYIDRLKKNQLLRVLRPSGLILNIVETTFKNYYSEKTAIENIPTFSALSQDINIAKAKAEYIFEHLNNKENVEIVKCESLVGGGCMPKTTIPSYGLSFTKNTDKLKNYLASQKVPIIVSIYDEQLVINTKVIFDKDLDYVVEVLNKFI